MARNDQDLDAASAADDVSMMDETASEPVSEAYRGVGDDLRRERERVGWSVQDVSQRLKIRCAYIEAIENGDTAALPGHSYALGFVRSYAELMGADGELCVDYYKQETTGQGQPLDLHFPIPSQESRRPGMGALALCVLLAAGAYGVYYYYQNTGRTNIALVPDVPDEIAEQVSDNSGNTGGTVLQTNQPAAGGNELTFAETAPQGNETQGVAAVSIAAMTSTEANAAVPADGQSGGVNASLPQVSQVAPKPAPVVPSTPVETSVSADAGQPAQQQGAADDRKPRVEKNAPVPAQRSVSIVKADRETNNDAQVDEKALKVASLPPPPLPSVEREDRAPRAFGDAGPTRVVVHVSKPTRVIISRVDGRKMLDRRLIAGDSYSVPDQQGLVLQAEDVSALSLQMDGQKLALPLTVGKAEFPLATDWLEQYR